MNNTIIPILAAAILADCATAAAEFHVAPNGSDTHSGTLGSPFATLKKARDTIRGQGGDVVIHGGTLRNNICWHKGNAYDTLNKGANQWENNVIQPTKPAGFDARLKAITAEAGKSGGWPKSVTREVQDNPN